MFGLNININNKIYKYNFEMLTSVRSRKTFPNIISKQKTLIREIYGGFVVYRGIVGLKPDLTRQAMCLDDEASCVQQINQELLTYGDGNKRSLKMCNVKVSVSHV